MQKAAFSLLSYKPGAFRRLKHNLTNNYFVSVGGFLLEICFYKHAIPVGMYNAKAHRADIFVAHGFNRGRND